MQGTPLLKMEAVGDGRIWQKRMTAVRKAFGPDHGKGEKVCVRDHRPSGDRRAVPSGGCKFA